MEDGASPFGCQRRSAGDTAEEQDAASLSGERVTLGRLRRSVVELRKRERAEHAGVVAELGWDEIVVDVLTEHRCVEVAGD